MTPTISQADCLDDLIAKHEEYLTDASKIDFAAGDCSQDKEVVAANMAIVSKALYHAKMAREYATAIAMYHSNDSTHDIDDALSFSLTNLMGIEEPRFDKRIVELKKNV